MTFAQGPESGDLHLQVDANCYNISQQQQFGNNSATIFRAAAIRLRASPSAYYPADQAIHTYEYTEAATSP
ncbi:MAG: hypothetical protein V4488_00800 [Pseudomonadota bacterium]